MGIRKAWFSARKAARNSTVVQTRQPSDHGGQKHSSKAGTYEIDRPGWTRHVSTIPKNHDVTTMNAPPGRHKKLLADLGPGLIDGLVTVDDRT